MKLTFGCKCWTIATLTSHAYDETLAVRIYTRIVHDYAPRLARMAQKIQTLGWD